MDCVSVCPNEALYFGLTNKAGSNVSSGALPISSKTTRTKKTYDFSLAEELTGLIVVGVTVYAVRGLYDIAPLLLSVAVGVITAYLSIQFFRFFRKRDLRIQNIQLKRNGFITNAGGLTVVGLSAWFLFLIHSFLVQYNRYQGRELLNRVSATWPELLDGSARSRLTQEDHAIIDQALRSFRFTDRIGIKNVTEVKLGLTIGNMMKGDLAAAENYLRQAYDCDGLAVREMIREFLVTQDRQAEAAEIQ